MMNIAKCKKCDYVYAQGNQTSFPGMPATCPNCKGDMGIDPMMESTATDLTYELLIYCKETNEKKSIGFVINKGDVEKIQNGDKDLFVARVAEVFAQFVTQQDTSYILTKKN